MQDVRKRMRLRATADSWNYFTSLRSDKLVKIDF